MNNAIISGIRKFIDGAHVLGEDGLRDYHAAAAVRDARRIKSEVKRFTTIKSILHPYRITVSPEGPYVRLRRNDNNAEMVI